MAHEKDLRKRLLTAIRKHSGMEDETLLEVASHSADAGWSGFTYYTETTKFYDENKEDIWTLLNEAADDQGLENVMELISSFGGAANVSDDETFKNLLSWFALEEITRWFADTKEQEAQEAEEK